MIPLGMRLRAEIGRTSTTVAEVAAKLGIGTSHASRIMSLERPVPLNALSVLAQVCPAGERDELLQTWLVEATLRGFPTDLKATLQRSFGEALFNLGVYSFRLGSAYETALFVPVESAPWVEMLIKMPLLDRRLTMYALRNRDSTVTFNPSPPPDQFAPAGVFSDAALYWKWVASLSLVEWMVLVNTVDFGKPPRIKFAGVTFVLTPHGALEKAEQAD